MGKTVVPDVLPDVVALRRELQAVRGRLLMNRRGMNEVSDDLAASAGVSEYIPEQCAGKVTDAIDSLSQAITLLHAIQSGMEMHDVRETHG
ncbi:hypothetical protein [Saccharopolyspora sp. 6M]|uniref:hypothetical protein n=1 Tax=Saccharopolyspora sp. 6M TaxID=2877237 RepID=UPI001CD5B125|nr:hypothetical protein [Saccharopolyspora sp. 6M]MCA1229944.1 hypothetical protein [Saccharopolyspora sp. 6M]